MRKILAINNFFLIFISLLLFGCDKYNNVIYIDYVKLSENSYLGVSEIQDSLEVPWDIQYSESNNSIFFTEIKGQISELDLETNTRQIIYTVPNVYHQRTLGLLGLALHPDFKNNPYLYVCYTTKEGEETFSELTKLKYEEGKIVDSKVLLKIEGASGHNGSRLVFDKDGFLYWATGDAHSQTHSQDSTTLNGKILRMDFNGEIPKDNPIANSYVYAWGFRNIQGLTVTDKGTIFTSEHGDAIEDEVNWIKPLNNYGWINIEGYHDTPEEIEIANKYPRTEPIKSWTPVIAPAGLKYYEHSVIKEWNNSLILVTLKDQSFRVLKLNDEHSDIIEEKVYFKNHYGRIRAVTTDRKGNIYIATSNRDWNPQKGFPLPKDDRILKISKIDFIPKTFLSEHLVSKKDVKDGKSLYQSYCASCHKEDGKGLEGSFPPLIATETVQKEKELVHVLLNGLSGKITVKGVEYNQVMPAFNFLSNDEIVAITNYVRNSFGNSYTKIDSILVKELIDNKF